MIFQGRMPCTPMGAGVEVPCARYNLAEAGAVYLELSALAAFLFAMVLESVPPAVSSMDSSQTKFSPPFPPKPLESIRLDMISYMT